MKDESDGKLSDLLRETLRSIQIFPKCIHPAKGNHYLALNKGTATWNYYCCKKICSTTGKLVVRLANAEEAITTGSDTCTCELTIKGQCCQVEGEQQAFPKKLTQIIHQYAHCSPLLTNIYQFDADNEYKVDGLEVHHGISHVKAFSAFYRFVSDNSLNPSQIDRNTILWNKQDPQLDHSEKPTNCMELWEIAYKQFIIYNVNLSKKTSIIEIMVATIRAQ